MSHANAKNPAASRLQPCAGAVHWLVEACPDATLHDYLSTGSLHGDDVFRGSRASVKSAGSKLVRARVQAALQHHPAALLGFLMHPGMPWDGWATALNLLDRIWLEDNWRPLMRLCGGRPMAAALATAVSDSHPAVAERGWRLLRRERFWASPPPAKPSDEAVRWELEALAPLAGKTEPAPRSEADAELAARQEERLKSAEREQEKLTQSLAGQRAKTESVEHRWKEDAEAWNQERADLRRRLKAAEEAQARLAAEFDQAVERRLNGFRREVLGLDERIEAIGADLAAHPAADLCAAVEAMVARHAQLNEGLATLTQVHAELARLERARARLEECLAESLRVLPEAHRLADRLAQRIAHLRQHLRERPGAGVDAGDPAEAFLRYIRSATPDSDGIARLAALGAALAGGPIEAALGKDAAGRIEAALSARRQRLVTLNREKVLAAMPAEDKDAPAVEAAAPPEIWDVESELRRRGEAPPSLIVDGYNVIRRDRALDEMTDGDGLAQARELLCQWCRARSSHFRRIDIVFDGVGLLAQRETADTVAVVFSGQPADSQNADDCIVRQATAWHADGQPTWVVTDDYGLRHRLEATASAFIGVQDFARFLRGGRG